MSDFDTKYKALLQEYANKVSIPNWFISGIKTLSDRNITIEDWNRMYSYLERMSSDNEVQSKILNLIKEELILKANKESVDSEILFLKNNKADKQYVDLANEEVSRRIGQNEIGTSANSKEIERLDDEVKNKADLSYVKTQDDEIKRVKADVDYVDNEITMLINDVADLSESKADSEDVYTKVETDNKLVNKVDTNYLTSNYFDKEQIKEMLGTISALDFKIVDSLPTDNISATTIYLIPYESEYEEYIYINNRWEMLGSTKVNLSDYVRKDEIIITNENGTTKAVGGISAGTILKGKNVLQVLEDILYPYVAFSISVDSITPSTSVYEIGTTATITSVTVKLTNGSKNITNLKLYDSSSKTNLLGEKTSGISTSNTFTISRAVTSSTSFYAEATDGVQTIGDSTSFLSFYYPTFYGVLDTGYTLTSDLITSKTKALKSSKSNTFTYTANNQHPFVAFPASYGNLTSIKDSSNLEYIGDFVKTTMNLNVTGGTVSYNIYVLKDPTDISNYKFIFS